MKAPQRPLRIRRRPTWYLVLLTWAGVAVGCATAAARDTVGVTRSLQEQLDEQTKRVERLYRALGPHLEELERQGTGVFDLPTLARAPNPDQLVAAIEKCKSTIQANRGGHVVIGRVVLDGTGDPRDIAAQMPILEGGYFAGETKDLARPIGFRMHEYAPLDVTPVGRTSDNVVDLGELHLIHLGPADRGTLTGRVVLAGGEEPTTVKIGLSVVNGPVNTPHNGTSPRSRWPKPIAARVAADGAITAGGFSPITYWCRIEAPGYVTQSREIKFTKGRTLDLGTITVSRPKTVQLSYVVVQSPPFDLTQVQQAAVRGGERWKATPEIYGWDLEFKQDGDKLSFAYSYAPCTLTDLGANTLEQFGHVGISADSGRSPRGEEIKSGHVYLLNQAHWKRWVLFRVEIP